MKEVMIKSKMVGREGSGTGIPSPSSPSASVDLSLYLKKEVWDDAFELKETEDGVPYLFGKLPVLLQYGLTMYADPDNVGVPSLFDGIPIDNNTIYWDETTNADGSVTRVLKAKGVGGEGGSAEFGNVLESGTGNAFTSFSISEDGKELTLVKGETFAKQTDLNALSTKLNDFLEGSDTDNIINKWKELESFLSGMSESSDLADILSGKAEKATTLSGYGITNAYTKTETDDLLDEKADWGTTLSHYGITNAYTKTEVTNLLGDYLPLSGGTITGKLRLRTGSEYTSPYLYFGDSDEVYLKEATDQYLTIHADKGILLTTDGNVTLNGNVIATEKYIGDNFLSLSGGTMAGTIQSQIIRPKTSNAYSLGTSSYLWSNVFTKLITIDGIEIKKSAEGVLFIDGDVVVSGGLVSYARETVDVSTIMDGVRVDGDTIIKDGNVLKLNPDIELGGGGSGITDLDYDMIVDALGFVPYDAANPNGYVTSSGSVAYATNAKTAESATNAKTAESATNAKTAESATNATKLSTVSKTAWGKTYWTSGGIPTNIDGDMSNVGNVTFNKDNTSNVGEWGKSLWTLHANIISAGGDAHSLWLVGSSTSDNHGIVFARNTTGAAESEIARINSTSLKPYTTNSLSLGTSSNIWSNLFTKKATIDGVEIRKTSTGVLYLDGDLVVKGGIVSHGLESVNISTIMDGVVADERTITNDNGILKLHPDVTLGDGGVEPTWDDIEGKPTWIGSTKPSYSYSEITGTPSSLKNPTSLSWSGYSTGSYDGSSAKSFVIPNNTNQLTNGAGFVTASGSVNYATSAGSANYATSAGTCSGNASTATELQTARTIWGRSFDGSGNVSGDMSNVGDISFNADAVSVGSWGTGIGTIHANLISCGGSRKSLWLVGSSYSSNYGIVFARNTTGTSEDEIARLNGSSFKPYSSGELSLGTIDEQWEGIYLGTTSGTTNNSSGVMFGEDIARIGASAAGALGLYAETTIKLCTDGEQSSGAVFDTSGNLTLIGSLSQGSDVRYKVVHKHIHLPIEVMATAPCFEFHYTSDKKAQTHIGTSAQYWQSVDGVVTEGEDGRLNMDYPSLGVVMGISLACEVKMLKEKIRELETEVESLKNN